MLTPKALQLSLAFLHFLSTLVSTKQTIIYESHELNRLEQDTYSVCSEVNFQVGELAKDLLTVVASVLDLAVLLEELERQGLVPSAVLATRPLLLGCWSSCRGDFWLLDSCNFAERG